MNYKSFERKSWDQDINYKCYEIFKFDKIEYNIERSQRMNQKYMNEQDYIKYINTWRIYI